MWVSANIEAQKKKKFVLVVWLINCDMLSLNKYKINPKENAIVNGLDF